MDSGLATSNVSARSLFRRCRAYRSAPLHSTPTSLPSCPSPPPSICTPATSTLDALRVVVSDMSPKRPRRFPPPAHDTQCDSIRRRDLTPPLVRLIARIRYIPSTCGLEAWTRTDGEGGLATKSVIRSSLSIARFAIGGAPSPFPHQPPRTDAERNTLGALRCDPTRRRACSNVVPFG